MALCMAELRMRGKENSFPFSVPLFFSVKSLFAGKMFIEGAFFFSATKSDKCQPNNDLLHKWPLSITKEILEGMYFRIDFSTDFLFSWKVRYGTVFECQREFARVRYVAFSFMAFLYFCYAGEKEAPIKNMRQIKIH